MNLGLETDTMDFAPAKKSGCSLSTVDDDDDDDIYEDDDEEVMQNSRPELVAEVFVQIF